MNELEEKTSAKTGEGGGGGAAAAVKKHRKRSLPPEHRRCSGRLPNGRRCEAASLRHSRYCVFHDPVMHKRRLLLAVPVPYEHPDELQRLLAEAVEEVKKGKLEWKAANAIGYLATLLMQNQPRVAKERERVDSAQPGAELQAVMDQFLIERGRHREKQREAEESGEEGHD